MSRARQWLAVILVVLMPTAGYGYELPLYLQLAPEIMGNVTREILTTYELSPVFTHTGLLKNVEMIGVSYRFDEPVSIEEARCLAIDCASRYWDAFNANEAIRPYLANYPFGAKNVDVGVSFYRPDGSEVYYPAVHSVSVSEGYVLYYYLEEGKEWGFKEVVEKPFEEEAQKNAEYLAQHPDCLEKFRKRSKRVPRCPQFAP